jgi:hypothetical protein
MIFGPVVFRLIPKPGQGNYKKTHLLIGGDFVSYSGPGPDGQPSVDGLGG